MSSWELESLWGFRRATGPQVSLARCRLRPTADSFPVQICLGRPGMVLGYQLWALQDWSQGLIDTSPKQNINHNNDR